MRTGFVLWLALLLGGSVPLLSADALVIPVIDRLGVDAYCGAATEMFVSAETSIDLLLSNAELKDNPLWESLVAAHERGVAIRVLLDSSDWAPSITEKNRPAIDYLVSLGIDARYDDPEVTTHAKLVIVDRKTVLVGSTNWNRYAFREHEQANLLVTCDPVGQAFATYFDRLWNGDLAPEGIELGVDLSLLEASTGALESPVLVPLFDTEGTATYAALVLDLLDRAERSVHVAVYRISVYAGYQESLANELIDAVVAASGRGLDVRVILDDCKFYSESADANLTSALYLHQRGVPVRFDAPEVTTHVKMVVIDGETVVLGSTNWNYYALERNVETNLAVLGSPELASVFDAYFETLWGEGRTLGP